MHDSFSPPTYLRRQVTVHLTSGEGGILATLPHSRRVLCMTQSSDDVLLTGVEDGSVKVGVDQ